LWKTLNSVLKQGTEAKFQEIFISDGNEIKDLKEIVEEFNDYSINIGLTFAANITYSGAHFTSYLKSINANSLYCIPYLPMKF